MENNEIMNFENAEFVEDAVGGTDKPGKGAGVAVLVCAGVALAVGAGVKLVKKIAAKQKAKKAINYPDHPVEVDEEDLADVVAK